MKQWIEGYKIVRQIGEELCSFNEGFQTYKEGCITYRYYGHGPLCLFNTMDNAIKFLKERGKENNQCYIYKCQYLYCHNPRKRIWCGNGVREAFGDGVIFANQIILQERIRWE